MDNFNLQKYLAEGRLLKEELTPLQQYVFNYEKDISDKVDSSALQAIKGMKNADDVYDYYAYERGWEGSMDNDLESIYKQVKGKFKGGSDDGLTDLQRHYVGYIKTRFGKEEAEKDLELIKSLKTRQELLDYVYDKVKNEA